MKQIEIKGKSYVMVNERVKEFLRLHPDWTIATQIIKADGDECLMVTTVSDESGRVRATGHAYERQDAGMINKTSHVENCETSAVGRALGFLGIGIDDAIASAEEVTMAINRQELKPEPAKPEPKKKPPLSYENLTAILKRISEGEKNLIDKVLYNYEVTEHQLAQLRGMEEFNTKLDKI